MASSSRVIEGLIKQWNDLKILEEEENEVVIPDFWKQQNNKSHDEKLHVVQD